MSNATYGMKSSFPLMIKSVVRGSNGAIAGANNVRLVPGTNGLELKLPQLEAATVKRFATACSATALVLRPNSLIPTATGNYWIAVFPERMVNQGMERLPRVAGATGSAFLVTPRHLVTAAHVIGRSWVADAAFVFDFTADCLREPEGDLPLRYEFARDSVVFGGSLVFPTVTPVTDDIAVIELNIATVRSGLAIAGLQKPAINDAVALVGCARFQPLTVVADTPTAQAPRVFKVEDRVVHTNVDAFQGSSGSALLDENGDVLGVHVDIIFDDQNDGDVPTMVDEDIAVASAVRMAVIEKTLNSVGAVIRA